MLIHGWGRYPRIDAEVIEPESTSALESLLAQSTKASHIPRGAGRSYGDSALAETVISSRYLDNFYSLDEEQGILHCGAGLTIDQLLSVCIPRGWFLPVVPGTKFVSIGGAIAADIHGKNHHRAGSFCDFVDSFTLALASGELRKCSRIENKELFHGACGGMGLLGVIVDVTLRLEKVTSVFIDCQALPTANLQDTFDTLQEHSNARFVVAWLDCLAQKDQLGRGIVHVGEYDNSNRLKLHQRWGPTVPFSTPSILLNRHSMGLFNRLYYRLQSGSSTSNESYDEFFFPLDSIKHWNRLYGRKGFMQYQFVLPEESAREGMSQILQQVAGAGKGSFLAVLKQFGNANANLLSFPRSGMTLTLDFKLEDSLFPMLESLDAIVLEHGGRHYLAKDARLSESVFKAGYPDWQAFHSLKQEVDPNERFASLQSERIGLTSKNGTTSL